MPTFATIDGVSRELTSWPITVDGVSRELDSMIAAVGGVQREIFSQAKRWEKYSVRSYFVDGTTSVNISALDTSVIGHIKLPMYAEDYKESGTVETSANKIKDGRYFVYNNSDYKSGGMKNALFLEGYQVSGYDTQKGDYIETVTANTPDAYPENGLHTDGYWYVKI